MSKHVVPASVVAVLGLGKLDFAIILNDVADDAVIVAHRSRQGQLLDSMRAIYDAAESEQRDLTAEELQKTQDLDAEIDGLTAQINARQNFLVKNATLTAPQPRKTEPDAAGQTAQRATVPAAPAARLRSNHDFRNFGEFVNSVRLASVRGGEIDPRLKNAAASTYANEGAGVDGGFAVPPDWRSEIMTKMLGQDSLLSRTQNMPTQSNSVTVPVDETTPWQSNGGIQAYWAGEGSAYTQSKPTFREVTMKMNKLTALVPVTSELLEDSAALGAYVSAKAPEKMSFRVSDAIIRGDGVGKPLGILNSPALVTQAKENAQTADTINATNILKMFSRMPASYRPNAVWLIHPDAEPQLPLMTVGSTPIYMPPGGLSGAMYGTLLGRPVVPHQVCETLGDLADIMLVDFSQYLTALKTGGGYGADGIKADTSIHLWFDQDITAFKFTLRVAGMPWWNAAVDMRDGTNTQSPYVVLEAR